MSLLWRRDQVDLGQVFERDGRLYRVTGLIDDPVVILEALDFREGETPIHTVIGSSEFSMFSKLEQVFPGGSREDWKL